MSEYTGMKFSFILLFSVFFVYAGSAQDLEVGIFGGGCYYLGDVNPSGHF